MVNPLNGNTSETRGMIMSVAAVKALSVTKPKEGGQSSSTKSYFSDTPDFCNTSERMLSLAMAVESSTSTMASVRDAGTRCRPSLISMTGNVSTLPVKAS